LPGRLLGRLLLVAPISLVGWLLDGIASDSAELYLDNFVICRKPSTDASPIIDSKGELP
jgi:hypothetical protein